MKTVKRFFDEKLYRKVYYLSVNEFFSFGANIGVSPVFQTINLSADYMASTIHPGMLQHSLSPGVAYCHTI